MRLNDQMPGLPPWPFIEVDHERREIVVHGRHISYGRYATVRYLLRIAILMGFYYVGKAAIEERKIIPGLMEAFIAVYLPALILFTLLPVARWICWLFFRKHTKVRFTPETVTVRGKTFPTNTGVDIRFGAFEPVLKDRDVQREQNPRRVHYLVQFQKIQMIYGLNVIDITSIDNEARARQFVVVLQQAYFMSHSFFNGERDDAGAFTDAPAE